MCDALAAWQVLKGRWTPEFARSALLTFREGLAFETQFRPCSRRPGIVDLAAGELTVQQFVLDAVHVREALRAADQGWRLTELSVGSGTWPKLAFALASGCPSTAPETLHVSVIDPGSWDLFLADICLRDEGHDVLVDQEYTRRVDYYAKLSSILNKART